MDGAESTRKREIGPVPESSGAGGGRAHGGQTSTAGQTTTLRKEGGRVADGAGAWRAEAVQHQGQRPGRRQEKGSRSSPGGPRGKRSTKAKDTGMPRSAGWRDGGTHFPPR